MRTHIHTDKQTVIQTDKQGHTEGPVLELSKKQCRGMAKNVDERVEGEFLKRIVTWTEVFGDRGGGGRDRISIFKGVVSWTEYFTAVGDIYPPAKEKWKSVWGVGHSSGGGGNPLTPVIRARKRRIRYAQRITDRFI